MLANVLERQKSKADILSADREIHTTLIDIGRKHANAARDAFRNVFGNNKNLSLSLVCRNLFFVYKDAPVDPDISLSTANGLGGIDVFNYPSARTYGFNIKLNL